MKIIITIFFSVLLLALTGCSTNQNLPLMFAQSQTVGISISGGATEQGAEFTLGYKDRNIALVPVTLEVSDGNYAQLGSTSGENFEDSFSVLGQFEVKTATSQGDVGLGKFFATGAAAKALADGFASKLGGNSSE